jgi:hypothetical protein
MNRFERGPMNRKLDRTTAEFGLLATGSSPRWHVDVDEALDRQEWFIQIDGPQFYLYFQLRDLEAVEHALRFLRSKPPGSASTDRVYAAVNELTLGRFGAASVLLRRDSEDLPRCFLIVDSGEESTIHVTLYSEDIQMLADALEQVSKEISPSTAG